MKPGIKPTHLWHYTSQKYLKSLIDPRLTLKRAHQRAPKEVMKTTLIAGSLVLALMYSYGAFCPEEMVRKYIREHSCDPMAKYIPPPPKEEPMEPCPKKKK